MTNGLLSFDPPVSPFSFEGAQIRTLLLEGEPYFVAKDVAELLGYQRARDAIAQHCRGAVKHRLPTTSGEQDVTIIPERDVYRLVMRSKLPSAERFEEWVVGEVLPAIRKTGSYRVAPMSTNEMIAALAGEAVKLERKVIEQDARIEALEARTEPIRAPQAILTGGQEIKSRAKRRMADAHGISPAVGDAIFDYYWTQLRTGLSVVNPNENARKVTPYCDVFYVKTVNDIFNRVLSEVKPVGKQFQHKAVPGLFRIKPRAE